MESSSRSQHYRLAEEALEEADDPNASDRYAAHCVSVALVHAILATASADVVAQLAAGVLG